MQQFLIQQNEFSNFNSSFVNITNARKKDIEDDKRTKRRRRIMNSNITRLMHNNNNSNGGSVGTGKRYQNDECQK